MISRRGINDTKVNLVGESLPNYARIDHFSSDPYPQQTHTDHHID